MLGIDIGVIYIAAGIFVGLFGIINPVGNIMLFISLTENFTPSEKSEVINKTVIVATAVLFIFGLVGNYIFSIFGITIPAFRIAGGILIFSIGFDMLQARPSRTKHTEHERQDALEKEALGITPLGVPLYAGPGAITTVMLYLSKDYNLSDGSEIILKVWVFVSIVIVMALSYLFMKYSEAIFKRAGRSGLLVFSRIMGLLITAIAVEFIAGGIYQYLSEWGLL